MVTSSTSSGERWVPLSGLVFVVLAVVAIVVFGGNTPDSHASAAKVASYYKEHQDRESVGAFVLAASVPFLMIFGACLGTTFATGGGRGSMWKLVLVGGSAIAGAAWLLTAFLVFALADGADYLSADALQSLNVLDGNTWVAFNAALGVMMLGAAGCLLSAAAERRSRWLGWVALVIGVALFIPFADFVGLLLSGVWIVVASIMLARSDYPTRVDSRSAVS